MNISTEKFIKKLSKKTASEQKINPQNKQKELLKKARSNYFCSTGDEYNEVEMWVWIYYLPFQQPEHSTWIIRIHSQLRVFQCSLL